MLDSGRVLPDRRCDPSLIATSRATRLAEIGGVAGLGHDLKDLQRVRLRGPGTALRWPPVSARAQGPQPVQEWFQLCA
jgi:hypothetical protein